MLSIAVVSKEFQFDLLFNVIAAKIRGSNLNLVPLYYPLWAGSPHFRLIHGNILIWSSILQDDEKVLARML